MVKYAVKPLVMISKKDILACFFVSGVVACRCVNFGTSFHHGIRVVSCDGVGAIVMRAELITLLKDRMLASIDRRRDASTAITILSEERTSISFEQGTVKLLLLLLLRILFENTAKSLTA